VNSHLQIFVIFVVLSFAGKASATCPERPPGADPLVELKSLYEYSEFVFAGQVIRGPFISPDQLEFQVDAIWKGPDMTRVWLNWNDPIKARTGERRIIFASRGLNDGKWRNDYFEWCIPRSIYPDLDTIMQKNIGTPIPPTEPGIGRIEVILTAGVFLALGGVAVFMWTTRDV
jgi:hypothetical protein